MVQHKILSLLVLIVGAGGIRITLLLFLAASGVGCITEAEHDNVEVSKIHWQVIHTKGRKGKSKARSTRKDMRALYPTV